jgi:hypothetical protein
VADGHGKAFIEDDDPPPPPKLFVKGDTVDEDGKVYFKVFLSEPAHHPVFFKYATDDGSALANKDYEPVSHYAVIDKYDRGVVIAVQTKEDPYDENLENFFLKVFDVKGAIPVDTKGEALIVDDDPEPNLAINDTTITKEGYHAVLTVILSEKSEKTVTVKWETQDGTAVKVADYKAASGTLTFAPGDTSEDITLETVAGDPAHEPLETFTVKLFDPVNATINQFHKVGTVTIPAD